RGLESLIGELAVAKDRVIDHLGELAAGLHALGHGRFVLFDPRGVAILLRQWRARCEHERNERETCRRLNSHGLPPMPFPERPARHFVLAGPNLGQAPRLSTPRAPPLPRT